MQAQFRQRAILRQAREDGQVEVTRLADRFHVAPETVRRDLRELADRGVVQRVHGGALAVESAGFETDVATRSTSLVAERRRIATAAVELLQGAETVYIDEGATAQFVAEAIRPDGPTTFVTSSLVAARTLAEEPLNTVIMLGGRVRGRTLATVDHWAIRMLDELVLDLAILGANGVSREHGMTTPDPAVSSVKRLVVERSRRRVFVGSRSKFGVTSFCQFAQVADFEALVTTAGLPTREAHRYAALGPQVIRA